jgi:chemotaxis protein CheX
VLDVEAYRGDLYLKDNSSPKHHVSGVIGLSGKAIGTVVLSVSTEVALKAASTMLMAETTEINDDVIDAIGELTNMVAGTAKAELEEYELSVSLPNVITGNDHDVHFPSNVTPICVPFETEWGPLSVEVGLAPVVQRQPARVATGGAAPTAADFS